MNRKRLWQRWVAANALGELIGLGSTFSLGFLAFSAVGEPNSVSAILFLAGATVLTGTIEGAVVGFAQWQAMRNAFPITLKEWLWATLWGALCAWLLGIVPSTLLSLGEQTSGAPATEPPLAVMMMLGGAMGLVLGVVLAFPQWLILKNYVARALWWFPANSLAWLLGMPIIFGGMDIAFTWASPLAIGAGIGLTLLIAGAAVGAVHGAFLVAMSADLKTIRAESL